MTMMCVSARQRMRSLINTAWAKIAQRPAVVMTTACRTMHLGTKSRGTTIFPLDCSKFQAQLKCCIGKNLDEVLAKKKQEPWREQQVQTRET